jgi:hypothetical protein
MSFLNVIRGFSDPLSSPTAMWENVFLLILTAFMKIALTAWTFGMMVHRPFYAYIVDHF